MKDMDIIFPKIPQILSQLRWFGHGTLSMPVGCFSENGLFCQHWKPNFWSLFFKMLLFEAETRKSLETNFN